MKDDNYDRINGDPDISIITSDENKGKFENLPINTRLETSSDLRDLYSTVYGNDLRNEKPCKMGGLITCLFYKGQPIITIGSQCKIEIYYRYLLFFYFYVDTCK